MGRKGKNPELEPPFSPMRAFAQIEASIRPHKARHNQAFNLFFRGCCHWECHPIHPPGIAKPLVRCWQHLLIAPVPPVWLLPLRRSLNPKNLHFLLSQLLLMLMCSKLQTRASNALFLSNPSDTSYLFIIENIRCFFLVQLVDSFLKNKLWKAEWKE